MPRDEQCVERCADALWPAACRFFCSIKVVNPPPILFHPKDAPILPADTLVAEKLHRLEDELQPPLGQAQPTTVLEIAEALRTAGLPTPALWISLAIPRLVSNTDVPHTQLLAQALQSQARSLEALTRVEEAESAFALAGHLYSLAGQIQR
jgi:hypothetical protein